MGDHVSVKNEGNAKVVINKIRLPISVWIIFPLKWTEWYYNPYLNRRISREEAETRNSVNYFDLF